MRIATILVVAMLASNAHAFGTYRAGNKVLAPDDSSMRVLDAMGEPRAKEPVFNRYGAPMGTYWYYKDGSKTVKFFISGGRVVSIEEIR